MIPLIDLAAQQTRMRAGIEARIRGVLDHGRYIHGPEVAQFEAALCAYTGAAHAVACANGTDALLLALMALQIRTGDAVICPSFTFAATAEVIPSLGATPVFADIAEGSFNLCPESFTRAVAEARRRGLRPAAVIPVDLFGCPADQPRIAEIAAAENLTVIADAAQSFGASIDGRHSVTFGAFATTSFFPAKPLGCYGDGGAVFTPSAEHADMLRSYRVHGKGREKYDNVRIGMNSRLDTLQAAILLEKLAAFPDEVAARARIADRYTAALADHYRVPEVPAGLRSVWAQYTLRAESRTERDAALGALKAAGIGAAVYYPLPLHRQPAYAGFATDPAGLPQSDRAAETVFSIPMFPDLTPDNQDRVIEVLRARLSDPLKEPQ